MSTVNVRLLGGFEVTVDGVPVPDTAWQRRQASALVKILALASGHRLHREQVLDLLWPDDPPAEAAPRLHKAAHYARRAIGLPNAIVLRGEQVLLCPDDDTTVDVDAFDALADGDPRRALALYRGELLPADRFEAWTEEPRERLRRRHLDLLRRDARWEDVVANEPADEVAHLSLMRRYAATGDRHAALRQFERLAHAVRRELGLRPGPEATALRDRLLGELQVSALREERLVGRDRQLVVVRTVLDRVMRGGGSTLLITGPAGVGKSALLVAAIARARRLGLRVGQGTSASVEGDWPYAPVLEALADLCGHDRAVLDTLPPEHRLRIDRVLSGTDLTWDGAGSHQRLFVAVAELVRAASIGAGVLLVVDDVHDADDASLRLLHHVARATRDRPVGLVLAHRPRPMPAHVAQLRQSLLERHGADELALGPLGEDDVAALVERLTPGADPELVARIGALSRGLPFAVKHLARRASTAQTLDADMVTGLPAATRDVLQRVAVVGSCVDTDEFVALSGLEEADAHDHLDAALSALVLRPSSAGYRFRHDLIREALLSDVPAHRRRKIHRQAADRLIELGASPARIGHHLIRSGAAIDAVPFLLRAARTEAAVGAYRDALALVDLTLEDAVRPHLESSTLAMALELRADLLNALDDPQALSAYREALANADADRVRHLRVELARCALMAGDLATVTVALDGVETDGGDDDAQILLTRGKSAFLAADYVTAQAVSDEAEPVVLAGGHSATVFDLVALRGMVAHDTGRSFDQLHLELRRTGDAPGLAATVFDGYLCPAEYLLYGPTPYPEVIAAGRRLRESARRDGASRAAAFASALIGEAALLSGDLRLAADELIEACALHRAVGSAAGEAHSLQRLGEVRLAQGDAETARSLLRQAFPLARGSLLAHHLLARVLGTQLRAARDPDQARAVVDEAEAVLGWDDHCPFCSIMLAVPATIACARVGDVETARRHLEVAERSARLWRGTAWQAGTAEARAEIAAACGDPGRARSLLATAAEQFRHAGQPLDAERCRCRESDLADQAGGANNSSAMLSGSRNDRPEP
jgi:DNA-binding SARP family transcriptional activator/tetratricopeptide (TPR) repeat protein